MKRRIQGLYWYHAWFNTILADLKIHSVVKKCAYITVRCVTLKTNICSKLAIDVPEKNIFEHLDNWTFLLLTMSRFSTFGVSSANFELVKAGLVALKL